MTARYFDVNEADELAQQAHRRAAYEQWRAMATAESAGATTSLAGTYPHMRPGTVVALSKAGISADHPVAQAAAKAEAKRSGFGWHSVGDVVSGAAAAVTGAVGKVADEAYGVVKGISRGAMIGLEAIPQTFQGAMRESTSDGDISGAEWLLGLPHLGEGFKQTTLYAGHHEVERECGYLGPLTGKTHVNYGSGFFAGGDVKRDQAARARAATPDWLRQELGGHTATFGRYTARQIFEPGTRRYSVLSGLLDAWLSLGADPSTWATAPVKGAVEAGRLPESSKVLVATPVDTVAKGKCASPSRPLRVMPPADWSATSYKDRT